MRRFSSFQSILLIFLSILGHRWPKVEQLFFYWLLVVPPVTVTSNSVETFSGLSNPEVVAKGGTHLGDPLQIKSATT
ncbi:hypothetical protein Ddc_05300 [Ditylenchus destructor]|nr:hypothetical protein Ddc_05300 [Ditylenchus destructor]